MTAPVLGIALLVALAGCATPDAPEPTPTTPFASEEEAFAAAEETYRAYVDALNAKREDSTAKDPQEFLTGKALEADLDTRRMLDESNLHVVGPNVLTSFEAEYASEDFHRVDAVICIDASGSQVMNEEGSIVTPADRDASIALDVTLRLTGGSFTISESAVSQDRTC